MKITVIGGTGHIGTYLTPRLVELGHEVTVISRGRRKPYLPHAAWGSVQIINLDREAEEKAGFFGKKVSLTKPEAVIDLLCFTVESCRQLTEPLRGNLGHFLHCGSLWTHGYSTVVPAVEEQPRHPLCEYGRAKLAIEEYLLKEFRTNKFPATILHPGHITGPGWAPINPAGHLNPDVFEKLAEGRELCLPNFGMETLHHVHADDVAQGFVNALINKPSAAGESFHIVSKGALTLRGFAEAVAGWFGKEAKLKFLPFEEWKKTVTQEEAGATYDHLAHSPNASIEKAKKKINYNPKYTSLEAVYEALKWLLAAGIIRSEKPLA